MPHKGVELKNRLHKDERYEQLIQLAHEIIQEEGTDALTLIYLAEKAGVTKPISYRHFGNRKTLLYTLFQDTLSKLAHNMASGIDEECQSLDNAIQLFANTYVKCFAEHGKSCFAAISALKAFPEYEMIDTELQTFFCQTLESSLSPFLPPNTQLSNVTLMMIFGATCTVGNMFTNQFITQKEAQDNIANLVWKLIH